MSLEPFNGDKNEFEVFEKMLGAGQAASSDEGTDDEMVQVEDEGFEVLSKGTTQSFLQLIIKDCR